MNIYLVSRYGNAEEGVNGLDTIFLVRACNYILAAKIVDDTLSKLQETRITPYSNWICEIGADSSCQDETAILKGPFYGLSGAIGYTSVWSRDSGDDSWISQKQLIESARLK
jgi:hypothetical protein